MSLNMKNIVCTGLCGLMLLSCNHRPTPVERLSVQLEIVNPDLETQFPGQLIAAKSCLLLFNPFVSSGCVSVLNKQTGEKIIDFLDTGQGPDEFTAPSCGYAVNNDTVTIFDLNAKKKLECNPESLSEGKASVRTVRFPYNKERDLQK
jgi:hypothetical protein